MSIEVSVLVPALNEEANLPELLERVGQVFERGAIEGELVVVDDGSTDGTWDVLESLKSRYPFLAPIRHERNRGMAAAWRTGAEAAHGRLVCIIDADLQYQPEDILRLLHALTEAQCDIVQGWRSPVARKKDSRYLWSRGLNWILDHLFGMELRDCKSGFILCSREVLQDLLTYTRRYRYWQSFIMVAAKAKGYSYREVETLFEERRAGESFLASVPITVIGRSFGDLAQAIVEYRIRPPRRDITPAFLHRSEADPEAGPKPSAATPPPPTRLREVSGNWRWQAFRKSFGLTHWMMTSDALRHLDELEATQWLSPEHIRELQDLKLRRLIRHAYRHVPFYRSRMQEAGVTPDDIQGVEDLAKLPLLTKDDVRRNLYFDIMSENHKKSEILKVSTSGSTGEPFVCFVDRAQLEFRWAATTRSTMWTGWRPGDPQVRLWHQTIGMSRSQVAREYIDAWLMRRRFIPAFEISQSNIEKLFATIEDVQPVLLDGYAESFNLLARFLKERGTIRAHPKGIISSAQQLPDESRRIIEEAFGCKVFDKYGSREFSGIAYECDAHAGHHVVAEGYVVEILKGGKACAPGEIGEVVVTDLNNYCLPFIRYRIGDLAEAGTPGQACTCGRGLPLIGQVQGRVQSLIIGAEGQFLPGSFFGHVFKDFDHVVRQYQIAQSEPGEITLRIVPAGRYNEAALTQILALLRKFLGRDARIAVELVERIELGRTGKRMQAVSHVALDLQSDADIQILLPR